MLIATRNHRTNLTHWLRPALAASVTALVLAGCGGSESSPSDPQAMAFPEGLDAGAEPAGDAALEAIATVDLGAEGSVEFTAQPDGGTVITAVLANQLSPGTAKRIAALDPAQPAASYKALATDRADAVALQRLTQLEATRAKPLGPRPQKVSDTVAPILGGAALAFYCPGGFWDGTGAFLRIQCANVGLRDRNPSADAHVLNSTNASSVWFAAQLGSGSGDFRHQLIGRTCDGLRISGVCLGILGTRTISDRTVGPEQYVLVITDEVPVLQRIRQVTAGTQPVVTVAMLQAR